MKKKKSVFANILSESYFNTFNHHPIESKINKTNIITDTYLFDKKFVLSNEKKTNIKTLDLKPEFKVSQKKNIFNIKSNINKSLQIKKISKSINGKAILKNVSLTLEPGKIVGLLGPNGSGKTTLFNLIIGKLFPDEGEIIFNNENINNLQIHTRSLKGLSLLEQHKGLFGNMTAEENLFSILELHIKDKEEINLRIDELLSYFDISYLKKNKANSLSGGEYKRLSILQRICNPTVTTLLLDEPCAALDPISINSLKKFILELKNLGLSILITDHNYWAIENILDKAYLIKDGQIIVEGPPSKISSDESAIKYYLGGNFRL